MSSPNPPPSSSDASAQPIPPEPSSSSPPPAQVESPTPHDSSPAASKEPFLSFAPSKEPSSRPSTDHPSTLRPLLPAHLLSYSAPPSILDPHHRTDSAQQLAPGPGAYTPLCPSARTSYTRVDGTATPRVPAEHDSENEDGEDASAQEDATELRADAPPDEVAGAGHGESGAEPNQAEQPESSEPLPELPQVALTFLLVSGRRRTMSFEPETTVGRVKELVWNAWPNDWQDERPPAPSYLRILYLGKILQDEDTLQQLNFPIHPPSSSPSPSSTSPPPVSPTSSTHQRSPSTSAGPAPTIVHLSIRAYAPPAEDAPKKRRRRGGSSTSGGADAADGEVQRGCCGCIIS